MAMRRASGAGPALLSLPFTVYVLFAVRLINAAGSFVVPFVTMILTRKLGWKEDAAGAFLTAVYVCGMAWTLAAGRIGDRTGRKRLIVCSQVATAGLFAACAAAGMGPFVPWLIAPAIILMNATWPVFNAVVADVTPPVRRKEAYSLLYWGNNLGFAAGPIIAGFLFERESRLMFALNALALLAVSALFAFLIRESAPEAGDPPDAKTASEGEAAPDEAATGGSAFRALSRRPLVLLFALAAILLNFAYNQHLFSLPIRLSGLYGAAGPGIFGRLMSVNAITVVVLTLPVTYLLRRLPPLLNMALASALYALGFGFTGMASSPWAFYALASLWTLGEIVSATNFAAYVAARSPSSHRARFAAAVNCVASAGTILCPAVSGAIIRARGPGGVWPAVAAAAIAGAAAMLALAAAERRRASAPPSAR